VGYDIDIDFEIQYDGAWVLVGNAWDGKWFPGRSKAMFVALCGDPMWGWNHQNDDEPRLPRRGAPSGDDARYERAHNWVMGDEFIQWADERLRTPCEWAHDLRGLRQLVSEFDDPGSVRLVVKMMH